MSSPHQIPGTTIFNGAEAQKGLALNKMCSRSTGPTNRDGVPRDPDAYMHQVRPHRPEQKAAVKRAQRAGN